MTGLRFLGLSPATVMAAALVLGGCGDDGEETTSATTFEPTTTDSDPTTMADTGDTGDTGDDADTTTPDVTFAEVEPIFQMRCVDGCHEPGGLWATHDMSGDIHAKIVGMPGPLQGTQCDLIAPDEPDASYIWHKINGTHTMNCGGSGLQMPVSPDNIGEVDPLPQADIDLIEGWILSGAPS